MMQVLLLALPLLVQTTLPPARNIVNDVVERTLADRVEFEHRNMSYTKTQRIYDTKGTIIPKLKEDKTWMMRYENGKSRQRLIKLDGKEIRGASEKNAGTDWMVSLPEFYDYSWARIPIQIFDNRETYVITFSPKQKQPKTKTANEKGLTRMSGTMYVDVEHLYIALLKCSLPKPFRTALWTVKVNTASATFSQQLYNELVVFDYMIIKINYALFGIETHNTYAITYENYAPRVK